MFTATLALVGGVMLDGVLLLAVFVVWMTVHVRRALPDRRKPVTGDATGGYRVLVDGVAGLVLLVLAGHLVVDGAQTIAAALGIPPCLIGATLVALGTSVPELATTLVAQRRGHDHVGIGMLLGSNVFNGLFIVGIAAVITPIRVQGSGLWIALGAALYAVVLAWPGASERLGRNRGVALIAGYAAYLSLLAVSATH